MLPFLPDLMTYGKENKTFVHFSSFYMYFLFRIVQQTIKDSHGNSSCIPLLRLLLSANILVH